MSDIKVKDLINSNVHGTDLFNDLESFMIELSDESYEVIGGKGIVDVCLLGSCNLTAELCFVCSVVDVTGYGKAPDPVDSPAPKGALK